MTDLLLPSWYVFSSKSRVWHTQKASLVCARYIQALFILPSKNRSSPHCHANVIFKGVPIFLFRDFIPHVYFAFFFRLRTRVNGQLDIQHLSTSYRVGMLHGCKHVCVSVDSFLPISQPPSWLKVIDRSSVVRQCIPPPPPFFFFFHSRRLKLNGFCQVARLKFWDDGGPDGLRHFLVNVRRVIIAAVGE